MTTSQTQGESDAAGGAQGNGASENAKAAYRARFLVFKDLFLLLLKPRKAPAFLQTAFDCFVSVPLV